MMTYKEKINYLSSYRRLVQECSDIQDEIVHLENKKTRMGGSFPKIPSTNAINNKSAIEELVSEIDALETRLRVRSSVFKRILNEIDTSISRIPDPTAQQLLRYRYIYGYTFDEIARKMHYNDRSYVHRYHKKIIKKYDFD